MKRRYYPLVVLAIVVIVAGCRLTDKNKDGKNIVACLGDSNTYQLGTVIPVGWCDHLKTIANANNFPNVTYQLYAMFGSSAISHNAFWGGDPNLPLDAEVFVQRAIANVPKPDTAIIAWGTNDILVNDSEPADIAARIVEIRNQLEAAGIDTVVALIPEWGEPRASMEPAKTAKVATTNNLIRGLLPAKDIVDFNPFPDSDYDADGGRVKTRDGIHFNTVGQVRRAQKAFQVLTTTEP